MPISRLPTRRIRVVLTSRAVVSYVSTWRATARALGELGCGAFFIGGVAWTLVGPAAPWFVLAAVLFSVLMRSADIEARALFTPGGLYGSVRDTLGRLPAKVAASALMVDRLTLAPLAALVLGYYVTALGRTLVGAEGGAHAGDSAPVLLAVTAIAVIWWLQREGRSVPDRGVSRAVGAAVGVLTLLAIWALATVASHGALSLPWPTPLAAYLPSGPAARLTAWPRMLATLVTAVAAFGFVLSCAGSVEPLGHAALDLEQPRIRNLRRVAHLVSTFGLVVIVGLVFVLFELVPEAQRSAWRSAPLVAVALDLGAAWWVRVVALVVVVLSAIVFLGATVRAASAGAHGVLTRLVDEGVLGEEWRALHRRFGTPARLIDATAIAQLAIVLASGGQVTWLARVFTVGVVLSGLLKTIALVRFRFVRTEKRAYRVPLNLKVGGVDWPVGLLALGTALVVIATCLLIVDAPSAAAAAMVLTLTLLFAVSERRVVARPVAAAAALDEFQLLPSPDEDLAQVDARAGNFLVPVRRPLGLTHLLAALRSAGDRDVVAMTVRLVGLDVPDDPASSATTTLDERRLLSAVVALAEREGKAVRLLIVPGVNVVDSIVETALRLESSEIHVGESETLSADDQARLLGEAWERTPKRSATDLRLVVHHPRGTAAYHMGAHAPRFQPEDFEAIHRLWLDVVRSVGPQVHHRDVVRAALKHMEDQLNGPNRDAVLALVRDTARPADELAAVIRDRDFGRLRDTLRNRPAAELAPILTDLSLEDQVLVFRILPRKGAAETFEYLSPAAQHALLKAMASEDVAALLNDMADDDRTMFLEELPAEATRQLLALLTPDERAAAVRLLGYPEGSIGRLMTSHYIAVREHWTVAEVFDYIRMNGQNSETFNMLYVVDDKEMLIDDVSIREFLLASPAVTVRSLMDKRFVALKATDAQETAVAVFKAEDRSALPVTDSAGVLIGIVTVDDVLDVAEAAATEDLQRFGGTEALDEPYMHIQFGRMIQKRAGWLTALFLGEMLTATAMGFFEREIEKAVILALFVPLIISSGGNSGSQASTLVIRALALGEVKLTDWWRVMRREFGAGLALGGILAIVGFLRITIWSAFSPIYGEHWILVAVTVAIALVGVVLWGTLVGSLLPFGLRRLGFDPAASSAPFVATLVDVTGLIIYFSVGIVILRGTLL